MNIWQDLPRPFFVLAPMDDVTDTVFRRVVGECAAPDLYFTEFVNVDGLQSPGRPKLLRKLRFTEAEQPLIAQIWGKEPDNFYKTAQQLADGTFARELGLPQGVNFAGVDLNMGCPEKSAVKNGTCVALINDRPLAHDIIEATKQGLDDRLPLSVKTRLGFNQVDLTWIEFLLGHELAALTVHGRTRREMSKVPAHWDQIGQARELRDRLAPGTLIVGNGDVMNRQHGLELARQHDLDGIMIGRGIFHDPFALAKRSPWESYTRQQRIDLYKKHVQLFAETWHGDGPPTQTLNKFCKIYINGFDGARDLRDHLMQSTSIKDLLSNL
ncbi:MAG TPA: tRNA-dihydrouridine synthase [Candidatus Saccharimonadales bacterium]|jgi:tRNA-dihydrouridine synthase|nr:tRNA-dihydrouridine synthase [Candidatus Saccharimonadales bacterium]